MQRSTNNAVVVPSAQSLQGWVLWSGNLPPGRARPATWPLARLLATLGRPGACPRL